MGVRNLLAICPNCGGKIHTQPKGLGHFTWANSSFLVQTGSECQHCGVALSGKVGIDNKAILARDEGKGFMQRAREEAGLVDAPAEPDDMDTELAQRTADWEGAGKPNRTDRLRAELQKIDGDERMTICPAEGKAVVIADPQHGTTLFGGRVVRGVCPDCGARVKRELPSR